MKKKMPYVLAGILLMISLMCMACGSTQEATALPDDANESIQDEEDEDLQNDPNDGLGGDLNEDTVNDFSGFEGIWLGEANNDYDYMEFDSEGNWTLYLSGEVMDEGYLRYEPEWEAIYAYSNRDDSGSRIAMEEGQLYSAAYGYFNPGEGMEYLWYKDGGELRKMMSRLPMWKTDRVEVEIRTHIRIPTGAGIRIFASGMFLNLRASGIMTAISRQRCMS